MRTLKTASSGKKAPQASGVLDLRIYVAGGSPKSKATLAMLRRACKEHLKGRCKIEVIDVLKNPRRAREHRVVALPTIVRILPDSFRKLSGEVLSMGALVAFLRKAA